jgi:hypothetical protein
MDIHHGANRTFDCIYVAASSRDARFTRICIASIRYFYPEIPVKLLAGNALQSGFAEEVREHWNVGLADLPAGDYGWGFVKLEPLFGRPGERFLVLDADTVVAGDILATRRDSFSDFLVDDEPQTEADTHRLYYDWRKVAIIDPAARSPQFVFNSGQWFGTAGRLSRDDFGLLIDWSVMPPRLRHPELFMPGEQGVLNYVLNQKAMRDGLAVDRRKIMRWPGHDMDGLDLRTVVERKAPPLVVHWAGMKAIFLRNTVGGDLLRFFEIYYYKRLPAGRLRRMLALWRHVWIAVEFEVSRRMKLRWQIWFGQREPAGPPIHLK